MAPTESGTKLARSRRSDRRPEAYVEQVPHEPGGDMVKDSEREELRRRAAQAVGIDRGGVEVHPGGETTFVLDPPEGQTAAEVAADFKDALSEEFREDGTFFRSDFANGGSRVRIAFKGLLE